MHFKNARKNAFKHSFKKCISDFNGIKDLEKKTFYVYFLIL